MLADELQALVERVRQLEAENQQLRFKTKQLQSRIRQLERQEEEASPPAEPEPWEVLGVAPGAPAAEVNAAFRALSRQHHPDIAGGDSSRFQQLTEARRAMLESL
jgi:DnaJ-class molecular chaperone